MALNKREMRILYITVAVILGVVLWSQGISPIYDRYVEQQDLLQKEEQKYKTNMKTLATASQIEEQYRKIEAQFPKDDPNKDPEQAFRQEVMAAAQSILP